MHPEVIQFLAFLREYNTEAKNKLDFIAIRISTVCSYLKYATKGKQPEYHEYLQQLMDLFSHVYYRKPLWQFSYNFTIIDSIR